MHPLRTHPHPKCYARPTTYFSPSSHRCRAHSLPFHKQRADGDALHLSSHPPNRHCTRFESLGTSTEFSLWSMPLALTWSPYGWSARARPSEAIWRQNLTPRPRVKILGLLQGRAAEWEARILSEGAGEAIERGGCLVLLHVDEAEKRCGVMYRRILE